MAKNDQKKNQQAAENTFQNTFNTQMNTAQQPLTDLGKEFGNQYNTQYDYYNQAVKQNMGDYTNIMGGYQNFLGSLSNPQGPWMNQSFGGGGGGGGGTPGYSDPFGSEYGGFQNFANGGGGVNWAAVDPNQFGNEYDVYNQLAHSDAAHFNPEYQGRLSEALGGYSDFAKTGGFSAQDIQDLRARAIAPTRAVYANAQTNLERNRALQGYSPNYAAATAKMARELAYGISDANVNANASIAQMVQQGKLAGMQGLTNASLGGQQAQQAIDQLNVQSKLVAASGMSDIDKSRLQGMIANSQGQLMADQFSRQMQLAGLGGMSDIDKARLSAQLQAAAIGASSRAASDALNERWQEALLGANLGALGGMTNLYGTTPGLTHEFGQQLNNTGNQQLGLGGLQNQLSLGGINAQLGNVQTMYNQPNQKPWWQSFIGPAANIGLSFLGMGGGTSQPMDPYLNSNDMGGVGNYGGVYGPVPPALTNPGSRGGSNPVLT